MNKYPVDTVLRFQDADVKVIGHATCPDYSGQPMHIIERMDKGTFCTVGSVAVVTLSVSPSLLHEGEKEITVKFTKEQAKRLYAVLNYGEVNFDGHMCAANEKLRSVLRETFNRGAFGLGHEFEKEVKKLYKK